MTGNGFEAVAARERASRAKKRAAVKARAQAWLDHLASAHGCRTREMGTSVSYLEAWHMVHAEPCTWTPPKGA